jgi:predicted nucleic acid-binding Zn ribbon protein
MADPRSGPRGLRPLATAIGRLRTELAPPTLLAQVQERWRLGVGEAIAAEAEPVSERNGVVTVSCRSATWSSELTMLSKGLLERLNEELPAGFQVSGLRFTTRPLPPAKSNEASRADFSRSDGEF